MKISKDSLALYQDASTLVISCVDFCFQNESAYPFNNILGLLDDYDNIMIPGRSISLVVKEYPSWQKTIEKMIPLLRKLHNITRIVLLDHRDCGAYGLIFGKDHMKNKDEELKLYREVMFKVKKLIEDRFPDLKVYCMLMGLDGIVENLSTAQK